MEIVWYGHSCFRMIERGMAAVVTDPYDETIGYGPLKLKADIVTVSHAAPGHNNVDAVKGDRRVIAGPGEFEIGGVFVTGIATDGDRKKKAAEPKRNTLYLFDFDGLTVCHLGDLDHVPSQAQIEALGAVDVALVPEGDTEEALCLGGAVPLGGAGKGPDERRGAGDGGAAGVRAAGRIRRFRITMTPAPGFPGAFFVRRPWNRAIARPYRRRVNVST